LDLHVKIGNDHKSVNVNKFYFFLHYIRKVYYNTYYTPFSKVNSRGYEVDTVFTSDDCCRYTTPYEVDFPIILSLDYAPSNKDGRGPVESWV